MTLESAHPGWTVPATPPPYRGMAAGPAPAAPYSTTIYGPPTPSYAPAPPVQAHLSTPWTQDPQGPAHDAPRPHPARAFGIASMVIGICSVPLYSVPILAVMAVVFAFVAFRKELAGRGMAITGLVTGGFVIVLWVFFTILLIVASIVSPNSLEALGASA